MGLLEEVADRIVTELESINDRLEKLEQRSEYNTDIEMLSVKEASEKLSLSEQKIYKMIRQYEIPAVEIGRKKLIPRRKLIEWQEENATDQNKELTAI